MDEWEEQFFVCVKEAEWFYRTANSIDQFDIDKMLGGGMYPFAVNISLACELFLKSIKIYETKSIDYKKTHNLYDLYSDVSKYARERISKEFNKESTHALHDFLKKEYNCFVEWRYAFERNTEIDVSQFTIFSNVLEKYVKELRGKTNE